MKTQYPHLIVIGTTIINCFNNQRRLLSDFEDFYSLKNLIIQLAQSKIFFFMVRLMSFFLIVTPIFSCTFS
jgi:hypothetical protein